MSDVSDKRKLKRYSLRNSVEVYDCQDDSVVGRLVNLHAKGMMIMGNVPLKEGTIYSFSLHLPQPINGKKIVMVEADCLWVRGDGDDKVHWAGCEIVQPVADVDDIRQLVELFGD